MSTSSHQSATRSPSPPFPSPRNPALNIAKHTLYFLRCLRTHLPTHYQSSESQRLSLAYFALSALDLLGVLESKTTPQERREWADWIYSLQHEGGGWKGFTGADVGNSWRGREAGEGHIWDPANLGGTFFALTSLMVLGDGMERVRHVECLRWLKRLQRSEGNFGEALGKEGRIEGGGDVRFCYLAAGVRWMLRRGEKAMRVEDVDVESMVGYIRECKTYEGGIAEAPGHEAHAGETFCGIAALQLLDRLRFPTQRGVEQVQAESMDSSRFIESVTKWLVSRQTVQLYEDDEEEDEGLAEEEEEEEEEEEGADGEEMEEEGETHDGIAYSTQFQVQGSHPMKESPTQPALVHSTSIDAMAERFLPAGFNGRFNKVADTCYSWWVCGALGVLGRTHLQNFDAAEQYLLDKTQHQIGGFSKMPGDPPDIMHSYLGLAALAVTRHPDLRSVDARICMSVCAREHFEQETVLGRGEG